jgi:hypothetical protein
MLLPIVQAGIAYPLQQPPLVSYHPENGCVRNEKYMYQPPGE